MKTFVITFHSVHDALTGEKVIRRLNVPVQLIPVPRDISSSCGIAARVNCEDRSALEAILAGGGLEIDAIYLR